MQSMRVDAVTAEVVGEMQRRGTRVLLLKGPASARWLYRDGAARSYRDTDLLVDPATLADVEAGLSSLGFSALLPDRAMPGWERPAHLWIRHADRAGVDVHTSIWGVPAPAELVWRTLTRDTTTLSVAGRAVEVLGPAAAAMHVALHAAQHGVTFTSATEDLSRALDLLPVTAWEAAASVARELDAAGAFATGLRLLPQGAAVADRLGLHEPPAMLTMLRSQNAAATAIGWEQLARARGVRARLALVRWELFPTRQFMQTWSALARRGPRGMAAARGARLVWLMLHGPPGLLAWHRARRQRRR